MCLTSWTWYDFGSRSLYFIMGMPKIAYEKHHMVSPLPTACWINTSSSGKIWSHNCFLVQMSSATRPLSWSRLCRWLESLQLWVTLCNIDVTSAWFRVTEIEVCLAFLLGSILSCLKLLFKSFCFITYSFIVTWAWPKSVMFVPRHQTR